jgi:hypothetical protein
MLLLLLPLLLLLLLLSVVVWPPHRSSSLSWSFRVVAASLVVGGEEGRSRVVDACHPPVVCRTVRSM